MTLQTFLTGTSICRDCQIMKKRRKISSKILQTFPTQMQIFKLNFWIQLNYKIKCKTKKIFLAISNPPNALQIYVHNQCISRWILRFIKLKRLWIWLYIKTTGRTRGYELDGATYNLNKFKIVFNLSENIDIEFINSVKKWKDFLTSIWWCFDSFQIQNKNWSISVKYYTNNIENV